MSAVCAGRSLIMRICTKPGKHHVRCGQGPCQALPKQTSRGAIGIRMLMEIVDGNAALGQHKRMRLAVDPMCNVPDRRQSAEGKTTKTAICSGPLYGTQASRFRMLGRLLVGQISTSVEQRHARCKPSRVRVAVISSRHGVKMARANRKQEKGKERRCTRPFITPFA